MRTKQGVGEGQSQMIYVSALILRTPEVAACELQGALALSCVPIALTATTIAGPQSATNLLTCPRDARHLPTASVRGNHSLPRMMASCRPLLLGAVPPMPESRGSFLWLDALLLRCPSRCAAPPFVAQATHSQRGHERSHCHRAKSVFAPHLWAIIVGQMERMSKRTTIAGLMNRAKSYRS